jgi:hypothetical protein
MDPDSDLLPTRERQPPLRSRPIAVRNRAVQIYERASCGGCHLCPEDEVLYLGRENRSRCVGFYSGAVVWMFVTDLPIQKIPNRAHTIASHVEDI